MRKLVVFCLMMGILLPTRVWSQSPQVATQGVVALVLRNPWPRLPTPDEITGAYNDYKGRMGKNVTITSGPSKVHTPWEKDPLYANKVVLTIRADYQPQPSQFMAVVLKYDFLSSRFKFEGVMVHGPGIHSLKAGRSTASNLEPQDLVYLRQGWISASPETLASSVAVPRGQKELCVEAQLPYQQSLSSYLGFTKDELKAEWANAVDRYKKETGSTVVVHENVMGAFPALTWLYGRTATSIAQQFIFTNDADRQKASDNTIEQIAANPGTELALYQAMEKNAVGNKKLRPGDVLYLALQQRRGELKEAFLLAHNVLRSLARNHAMLGVGGEVDESALTALACDPSFIGRNMVPLHLQGEPQEAWNTGSWYHIFGTAYFELQARGNVWGADATIQWLFDNPDVQNNAALQKQLANYRALLKNDPELSDPDKQTLYSNTANELEQIYRKLVSGSQKDVEKYCYNIWGAQIAAWLLNNKVELIPANPFPIKIPMTPTILGPIPTHLLQGGNAKIVISSSPINISWFQGKYELTLDQKQQGLKGYAPLYLYPYFETENNTWGAVWVSANQEPYIVRVQGTAEGWSHITILGDAQGKAVYPLYLRKGESVDILIDPKTGPMPIPGSNKLIEPRIIGKAVQKNDPIKAPQADASHIVYAMIYDNKTNQPVEGAAFNVLRPGVTTQMWIDSNFDSRLVVSQGISDKTGMVTLSRNLEKGNVYSFVAARESYQVVRYESLRITQTSPEPLKITIKLTR